MTVFREKDNYQFHGLIRDPDDFQGLTMINDPFPD